MTPSPPTGRGRRLALLAALLGWMFDGMEMGLFPLVGKDALGELLKVSSVTPGAKAEIDLWFGIVMACFLIGGRKAKALACGRGANGKGPQTHDDTLSDCGKP